MSIRKFILGAALVGWIATGSGQDVAAPRPTQRVVAPNQTGWRQTPEQQDTVERVTKEYFAEKDSGRSEEAYARLSPRLKTYLPFTTYDKTLDDFNAQAGEVQERRLRAVTWYKDTPEAGPGLYVAVDFSSRFPNLALYCGYVVWQEQPAGSFLLVREEVNVIDNATMSRLKPEDLEKVRSRIRC
jgi:hypothetical protein